MVANQINWGPMIIHRQFPKNNVIVSVYVRSSDNDTAAVIARWVDVSNYYFFSADPQNDRAQIVKVKNGLFSLLAVAPLTQIGSTWPNGSVKLELHALGPHLTGLINGNLAVTVSDGNAPHTTGYTGFMHAHMSDVAFSDFRATPKHDSQAFNASARSE